MEENYINLMKDLLQRLKEDRELALKFSQTDLLPQHIRDACTHLCGYIDEVEEIVFDKTLSDREKTNILNDKLKILKQHHQMFMAAQNTGGYV